MFMLCNYKDVLSLNFKGKFKLKEIIYSKVCMLFCGWFLDVFLISFFHFHHCFVLFVQTTHRTCLIIIITVILDFYYVLI